MVSNKNRASFDYSQRILELMKEFGISNLNQFSKRVGLSQATINGIVNFGRRPKTVTIEKICESLEIEISNFYKTDDLTPDEQLMKLVSNDLELYNALEDGLANPEFREIILETQSLSPHLLKAITAILKKMKKNQ